MPVVEIKCEKCGLVVVGNMLTDGRVKPARTPIPKGPQRAGLCWACA